MLSSPVQALKSRVASRKYAQANTDKVVHTRIFLANLGQGVAEAAPLLEAFESLDTLELNLVGFAAACHAF